MDYKNSGVDIEAGYKSVELMKKYVKDKMRLDPEEWVYLKNTQKELIIKNKNTGAERIIDKIQHNIINF